MTSAAPVSPAVPWAQAWGRSLYGERGFYRSDVGPAGHFATATHGATGRVLARALLRLARERGCTGGVVDVGAGRGELLRHLRELDDAVPLLGVDVVDRPAGLAPDVAWLSSPGGASLPEDLAPRDALVVAHEWLDVVPCTVAEVDGGGTLREVLVDPLGGGETLGAPLDGADLSWCAEHWREALDASAVPGDRVEVGRSRDAAWADLLGRLDGGLALAVDYGHRRGSRPPGGTLTAFREGREVSPVADGSCDLTAHVAVDSLRADEVLRQRDALHRLGVSGRTPEHGLASRDPASYLAGLAESGAAGALLDPTGYGGFWWVLARG
ncbi:SAM-dependent methyltransferase [Lapillicoccus jejuensis]|uniref:SAM-dependent methyltransferase n=1 Tax=Lapillicoccus jejuensis TaxID=402171 RepID=UPI001FE53285|nr:SAM-dependent methyltransferase [Lapillicoccus jejuensis]